MGMFDEKSFKKGVKSSTRNDDKDGTFWQKIDDTKSEEPQGGGPEYIKLYKTTVHVVAEGSGSQGVGDQTTQAIFQNAKPTYNFFERECKTLIGTTLGLTREERDRLEGPDGYRDAEDGWHALKEGSKPPKGTAVEAGIGTLMLKDQVLNGSVLEMKCVLVPKAANPDEFFTKVTPIRRVTQAELQETLTEDQIAEFFPEGLPEDVA